MNPIAAVILVAACVLAVGDTVYYIKWFRPYSWGCHYCETWHARSRTSRGGQKKVREHEDTHYNEWGLK